jgi:sugar lactone lactonase YvrE
MLRLLLGLFLITQLHAKPELELVAKFDLETPPGNIAISNSGRIFISLHSFFQPKFRLMEVMPDGKAKPYPNEDWALPPKSYTAVGLYNVLGLNCDGQGHLWLLDGGAGPGSPGKLVAWNLQEEKLHRVIYIPPEVLPESPFLNDLAIDTLNQAIYIADTAAGKDSAIIVVDLKTGLSRRVLHGHPKMVAEDIDMVIDNRKIMMGPNPARIGINPITIDHTREFVYFGAMSGSKLYRLATSALNNLSLSDEDLSAMITTYGDRPISDGISIDNAGHVYITAITENAIGVTSPDGTYKQLFQDDKNLSWPDSIAAGPDGYMYVVVNQLHRSAPLNQGKVALDGPLTIYRFKPHAGIAVGR